ncbi:MAG: amine dehydrogenase large subunit [Geminicoccaceae bacterium]
MQPKTIGLVAASLLVAAATAKAEVAVDDVSVVTLPPASGPRLYVTDMAGLRPDGRIYVLDGTSLELLGQIPAGFTSFAEPSADGSKIYNATTFHDRGVRGNKIDVLEEWNTSDLTLAQEVVLPPKRAMVVTYKDLLGLMNGGKRALVQNATPASSVTVVDLANGAVVGEVDTAGCWAVMPSVSDPNRFATICGDGTFENITLDDAGKAVKRARSAKIFDAQTDPIFIQSASKGDTHYFVTFDGRLIGIDISADTPTVTVDWKFTDGIDGGWRPGGYNPIAIHRDSDTIFVGMHANGGEGSHKLPAQEIWALDLGSKTVTTRAPGHDALAIDVTQTGTPRVYALKGGVAIVALDPANKLEPVGESEALFELASDFAVR